MKERMQQICLDMKQTGYDATFTQEGKLSVLEVRFGTKIVGMVYDPDNNVVDIAYAPDAETDMETISQFIPTAGDIPDSTIIAFIQLNLGLIN